MNFIQKIEDNAFAPPINTAALGADDLVWFNDLKKQFKVNEPPDNEPDPVKVKAKIAINAIIAKKDAELVGQDLADLETWLIEVLPIEELRQKVNSLRDDCENMAGEDAWKKILTTLTNQVATAPVEQLRPEARRLQQELHWRASIQPQAQNTRLMLMVKVLAMFGAILIGGCLMALTNRISFGGIIVIAGAFGALISCIQRIQTADLASSRAASLAKSDRLTLGVAISPILGGIFAVVFALALLAGQVTPGFVVPDVTVQPTNCVCGTSPTNAPAQITKGIVDTNQFAITGAVDHANSNAPAIEVKTTTGTNNQYKCTGRWWHFHLFGPRSGNIKATDNGRYEFFGLELCFKSGKDLVLLILWAFVAGFSERLVPDLLTRLADTKKG